MNELAKRKIIRLKDFDYSSSNMYYITICTEDRRKLLGKIHENSNAHMILAPYGQIVKKHIDQIENYYNVTVSKYIIMPNHIHLLILVEAKSGELPRQTMMIPKMIAAFKKFTSKEIGFNLWQKSYYDHIIRNETDYREIWEYIDENPAKWALDEYNVQD